eukprot:TRINITY_DN13851_c0_g1_i1.p1 TRINITY_DN13851_c0_g1~~TRINITY_DN13851_c0_g1_i1.p1  ORF type:complete len:190 (-),score=1.30 TRINITY_DN13851_c0_g1_i1:676-1245(-)
MGNITRVKREDNLADTPPTTKPEFQIPVKSQLIAWRCIHDNGSSTTPFLPSYDVPAFRDGNKLYIMNGKQNSSDRGWVYSYDVLSKQFESFSLEKPIPCPSWITKISNKVYFLIDNDLNIYDVDKKTTVIRKIPSSVLIYKNVVHCNRSIYVFDFRSSLALMIYNIDQGKWVEEKFRWKLNSSRIHLRR